jgi:magnesium transporter
MALGELDRRKGWRLLAKEVALAVVNGVLIGATVGGITYLWKGEILLGVVVSIAMLLNMIIAAIGGVVIPVTVRGLGRDPAHTSGIFLTTITDVVGFALLFVIARLLLPAIR